MNDARIQAQIWLDAHRGDLDGLSVDAAVALIERAGLQARVITPSTGWLTQEQRRDRVNLRLTASGDVRSIDAG